jgi:hypothetical protein
MRIIGSDLGLREGNSSFAIVADFTDADAYRAYDLDPAHNRPAAGWRPGRTDRSGAVRNFRHLTPPAYW